MEHPFPQQPNTPTDSLSPSIPSPNYDDSNGDSNNVDSSINTSPDETRKAAFGTRRAASNPAFQSKLAQMTLPLAPLVQLTTGQVHPAFPRTLLAFWLLTDEQLDSLAHFYHQRTPCQWTWQYPCPVPWPASWRTSGLTIEEKRRKLGRFIGLRGCETPIGELLDPEVAEAVGRTEEEIWGAARAASSRGEADDVEEVRRKMGWYS
ncbi:hypothetical protein MYCTH_2107070 [Thermothelomyces thermophilus ATCC 42464]|uniref:Beta-xylosidase n=1 Tax=Thermothelomyces thermophilus (strain ATCC 42464 / BCRC 31852 / DSM 1799) TaxID=573729 RepID=G2Q2V8_THET4|nr:uncharacterized protein MYCTH_2107070 [Thermothelomyces thermophilus ATCC 42464]AEO54325.1 hypothetical protein MYCTH_2107070 [Thermothelomyces thermophilus ATCC 42464]